MAFFERKIFQLILFITLINCSFSYLVFNYSYSFKLYTKNIFVIHQLGVSLVNDNFTEIISNEVVFNESDQINSEEDLSKVESVIGESHIICLIKKKFLIFNAEGYLLYYNPHQEDIKIDVPFYSLIYYKKDTSYVQFLVGYISDHKLNLILYGYQQSYQLISTLGDGFAKTNAIEKQALSCHNMNY